MFSCFSYRKMASGKMAFWKMASSVILNLAPGKTALSNLLWRMMILRRAALIHQMMTMCEDFCTICRSFFWFHENMGMYYQKKKKKLSYVVTYPIRRRVMGLLSEESKECCVGCVEHYYISLLTNVVEWGLGLPQHWLSSSLQHFWLAMWQCNKSDFLI